MDTPEVRIYDIMACDVYWDFAGSLPREQHKFLVSLYPTPGAKAPDLIERITARGPDGYQVEFVNQEFHRGNLNGWIYDRTVDAYWYMVNLATGFLAPGEYTIEIEGRDGRLVSASRVQDGERSAALVASYLTHREVLARSFFPSRVTPALAKGVSLDRIVAGQRTLKELDGTDAYYIHRLAECSTPAGFDTQNLVWWDNIFVQRDVGGNRWAGLNRGKVTIRAELAAGRDYGYFVEITDANAQNETNICVFQPHQFFRTP
ncbi:hypothetical protein BLA60_26800 [Actinophytocola xinjiangensis]|uniref:Uncharacterized protein n=1 Tax=Actinophytocola xinjiangensis TaxID=485602 RepID=A0A7Z1AXF4_9PSEU|nr:hypothetical protein [Actinophytocola xinjiangensis]OLF07645.1 hypothetical protein BLA60_26800 [Actinophytocola xinjiangensis]